jgi:hypothetical protein
MEAINGVTCIKGEIHSIMTLMRLNTRWSQSQSVRLSAAAAAAATSSVEENPMVLAYRRLNEYMEGIFDLRDLDCVMYIAPFYHIIVSNQGSGPLTSAALSSLSKFVMFGFMSLEYPRIKEGITLIANCISRCVFEETDWESDEVILMKLLELSTLVLRCNASCLLAVSAVWDIFATCISIHGQFRASKILRSEAETALRHLTLTAFSRTSAATQRHSSKSSSLSNADLAKEKGMSWEELSNKNYFAGSSGVVLLLTKLMTVLGSFLDLQTHGSDKVKFALSLVNIALEAGGPSVGQVGPLVDVLRGDICRHLLRASQSDDLAVFSLTLRVVFNLFMSIKDHMKTQLDVFLTSVQLRLLQSTQQSANTALLLAKEELALESLLEFCREPSLMQDIYANYDCDEQCTNLFDSIISTLANRCVPGGISPTSGDTLSSFPVNSGSETGFSNAKRADPEVHRSSILTRLALYGVTTVVRSVAVRCNTEIITPLASRDTTPSLSITPAAPEGVSDESRAASNVTFSGKGQSLATAFPSQDSINSDQQVDNWCANEPEKFDADQAMSAPPNRQITPQKQAIPLSTSSLDSLHSLAQPNPAADAGDDVNSVSSSPFAGASESHFYHSARQPGRNLKKSSRGNVHGASTLLMSGISSGNLLNGSDDLDISDGSDSESDLALATRARTVELLRQRKEKKQKMLKAAEKFNAKPLKNDWIAFALEQSLLEPIVPTK